MKAPLGYCPEEGCGKSVVRHTEGGQLECSAGHTFDAFKARHKEDALPDVKLGGWKDDSGQVVTAPVAAPPTASPKPLSKAFLTEPTSFRGQADPADFVAQAQNVWNEHNQLKERFEFMRASLQVMLEDIDSLIGPPEANE